MQVFKNGTKPARRLCFVSHIVLATLLVTGCSTSPLSTRLSYQQAEKNPAKAVAYWGGKYKSNPTDPQTSIRYAHALRTIGQTDQAVAVMRESSIKNEGQIDTAVGYVKALAADKQYDKALRVIDTNLRPDSPNWELLNVKASILDRHGNHAEARQLYQQALTNKPNEPVILTNLGLSYALDKNLPQAEAYLKKSYQLNPKSPRISQNLAMVLGLQGKFDEAQQFYALSLSPEQTQTNIAYLRSVIAQDNRWDLLKNQG